MSATPKLDDAQYVEDLHGNVDRGLLIIQHAIAECELEEAESERLVVPDFGVKRDLLELGVVLRDMLRTLNLMHDGDRTVMSAIPRKKADGMKTPPMQQAMEPTGASSHTRIAVSLRDLRADLDKTNGAIIAGEFASKNETVEINALADLFYVVSHQVGDIGLQMERLADDIERGQIEELIDHAAE